MESSWPFVQISPVFAPVWVMRALRPTVVPLMQRSDWDTRSAISTPPRSSMSARPFLMATVGSSGVESTLKISTSPPGLERMKSVNVPPASIPSRYFLLLAIAPSPGNYACFARNAFVFAASTFSAAKFENTTP